MSFPTTGLPAASVDGCEDVGVTQPPADVRAGHRVAHPCTTLLAGDLVNTAPGGEDDRQRVLSVCTDDLAPAQQVTPLGTGSKRMGAVTLSDLQGFVETLGCVTMDECAETCS